MVKKKIRGGGVEGSFIVDSDSYTIKGKRYPRVTRILDIIAKPEFFRWYAKHGMEFCDRVRDDRAVFGTRLHKEIQNILEGREVFVDSGEMGVCIDNFRGWLGGKSRFIPVVLEYNVFSDVLGCAGTLDCVARYEGFRFPWLFDWKSSKRVYDNYRLQVSVYLVMYESMTGRRLGGACIVCFTDKGVVEVCLSRGECYRLLEFFVAARMLYRWKYGR